ncbi:efflux RND transporter periplasmic adaptor subunit [Serratia oryzae]|uniref:efflux RND transporter periplasmic adaptor subunit n=1 Tax=Serratia oryzae TaxID=2034155 RepID=UPI0012E2A2D1|nr:efflux RND transporter periplasmic adaptor subunit [Serratia oryzae]
MTWYKNRFFLGAAVLIIGISIYFILTISANKPAHSDTPPEKQAALTVNIEIPQQQNLPRQINANGNIAAWQEASVSSEADGLRLAEIYVNVGDRVRKNQLLARFDPETVAADLAQAEAALAEAQANKDEASTNAQRARQLKNTGALSELQIDQYLAIDKTARARVQQAKAQVQYQRLRMENTRVLAPDDGIISSRSATVGNVANRGNELFRLIRQERLEWRAELTAAELPYLKPGMSAVLRTTAGTELTGRIRALAPALDLQTRNAIVYVDITPTQQQQLGVKAGMFAQGAFHVGETSALTVSQSALVSREGFHYLFAVDEAGNVSEIKVEVGQLYQGRFEILTGLRPDMRIVSSGAGFLNHGERVRVNPLPTGGAVQ